jgi:hypothetical protein
MTPHEGYHPVQPLSLTAASAFTTKLGFPLLPELPAFALGAGVGSLEPLLQAAVSDAPKMTIALKRRPVSHCM